MKRSPLTRTKRLKAKGRRRITLGNDEPYLDWIRSLPCTVVTHGRPDYLGPCCNLIEASHNRSRNLSGNDRDVIPLCANILLVLYLSHLSGRFYVYVIGGCP
jgi:hypothetical protein